ncbi:MAG: xanthine dehydrogenase molybdenum-binding subunit XdhA [Clostridia bacterium]|nr:xanthine dehydrogenase molybdenum-binding subunit XdhA [Clostridia bacterium]
MSVGKSISRVDAYEKVCGRAMYTGDLCPGNALVAKVVRSTIANGLVKSFDLSEAERTPGVVKILTCFDVPHIDFPTPGHPWSTEPKHQDVADRRLLNRRVRIYGDDIAAVIAEDELAAARAAQLVKADYEEYPALTTIQQAEAANATRLHEASPGNLLMRTSSRTGEIGFDEARLSADTVLAERYETQVVQHCHIEVPVSYAYMEKGRIVVVSSTQIPHIVRRVIGQALGIPWGKVRVVKPYIGGGFGNKQEVLYEPLNAWLTTKVGGRPVKLELSREETMSCTRTRHAIQFDIETAARKDGRLIARRVTAKSNQGGYASHGHAIVANAANVCRMLYQDEKTLELDASTIYTNLSSAGAMRGYGIPQAIFALESHMDDLALQLGMDPVEIRKKNCMPPGFVDPGTGIVCHSHGLLDCLEKGKKYIHWTEKRSSYQNQSGAKRRGVGMAMFCYKTGVYPISLETASARIILNQDGSVQLSVGATEIGQGADTVLTQMAAETLGLRHENVHIISTQDTDISPFDTGAYASRQTYVTGMAVKQTAEQFKQKLLDYAAWMLNTRAEELAIHENHIQRISDEKNLLTLEDLAMEAFYSLENSRHITAESTYHCKSNTFAFGACFAEIEVDIPLGKIHVLDVINVHDSGVLINPKLAEAQVHGGMSMGLGYALSERMLYDDKARPLNGNLLDYKLPTSLDTPDLAVGFVETADPSGPYGNKALGEPPAIPVAPAIRNALLHATGIGVNNLPMHPQKLAELFAAAGLIREGGNVDV